MTLRMIEYAAKANRERQLLILPLVMAEHGARASVGVLGDDYLWELLETMATQ